MSHLATTIRVAAPPEIVFDLVADPARGPQWQTMISDMGEISGRPGGVGSSYIGYYRVAGRRLEGRFVVTAELLTVNAGGLAAVPRSFEKGERFAQKFENASTIASGTSMTRLPLSDCA